MNRSFLLVLGAGLLSSLVLPSSGGPSPHSSKNPTAPKNPPLLQPPPPILQLPPPPQNRFGVVGTGGFGIEAEFLTEAYIKKKPHAPIHSLGGSERDDFSPGVEVFYERVFSDPRDRNLRGLRLGLGYTNIDIEDDVSISAINFNLKHALDADLVYFNAGPFYERRFTDRFYGQLGAGLTAAYINADLSTRDSTGLLHADADEDEFLFGAYASAGLGYDITRNWSLMGGIRYQYLESFDIDNGVTEAELEFDSAFLAFVGLRFVF